MRPPVASVRSEDCSFEKGICGWENITLSSSDRTVTWQRAFLTHRPAQLLDKTFGATGDYIFFDIFTANQKSTEVRLRSPIISASNDDESTCFTFWFAAFGVEESTMLEIIKTTVIEDANNGNDENNNDERLVRIYHIILLAKYKRSSTNILYLLVLQIIFLNNVLVFVVMVFDGQGI